MMSDQLTSQTALEGKRLRGRQWEDGPVSMFIVGRILFDPKAV
jgi:hypothetical protein